MTTEVAAAGSALTDTKEVSPVHQPIDFVIRAGRADTVESLRDYAARRLSFALRRFEHRIRHITVRLVDLNGPRRGVDSRCSMTVDLVDGRRIFVDATTAWPSASVTRAAGRLSTVLRREQGRATSHRGPSFQQS
jgi:putative sigma-54 modulation protein